jgi:SAM-dependent methyltransferase
LNFELSMRPTPEGWHGWDDYAPFYDWENAQTVRRRDIGFWTRLATQSLSDRPASRRNVLELGSGTGRVTFPLARAGVSMVGVDRSAEMLARAAARRRRAGAAAAIQLVRGDIRHLPFPVRAFPLVIAPYGILQSLLRERDLAATLASVHGVLERRGTFGLELVADLPSWKEYSQRVSLRGRRANGARIALVESVRQDRERRLTIFEQEFIERQGREERRRRFSLAFRTLTVPQMCRRLERAGFAIRALLGDYRGGPWDPRAEAWIVLARRR